MCAVAFALVGASAFAQASASDENMTAITDKVKTWLDGIVGSFKDFFTANFTTIVAILSIAVGVTVLWSVYKLFTKGAKKVG